jgi:predicted Zn-dependent protease
MDDPIARQRELVARHPGSELARFSLAKALVDRGQHAEAREHLEFCVGRKPDWMVAWILRGRCDQALGNLAVAKEAFSTARELAITQNHDGPLAELEAILAGF